MDEGTTFESRMHFQLLQTKFDFTHLHECESTNSVAAHWLRGPDKKAGAVILADCQTAGRGRLGRNWSTVAGEDLAMSLAWRLPAEAQANFPHEAALRNMQWALAIRTAILQLLQKQLPPGTLRLKWPNDLYLFTGGAYQKVGGILVEPQWAGDRVRGLVLGVGLNIGGLHRHRAHGGVSFREALGEVPEVATFAEALAGHLIGAFESLLVPPNAQEISAAYHEALMLLGQPAQYQFAEGILEATLERVHNDGTADFLTAQGLRRCSSSEIRWIRE